MNSGRLIEFGIGAFAILVGLSGVFGIGFVIYGQFGLLPSIAYAVSIASTLGVALVGAIIGICTGEVSL